MIAALAAANPEFRRQLWLEFSPVRLFGMPAVLALVFAAAGLAVPSALPTLALTGFVLIVWLWGARSASSALSDEVTEATWDAQRLSSLTPWQLGAGKLFGGTLYAWYGGACCLAVWALSSFALGMATPWTVALGVLATGLALQALALIAALVALRRGTVRARRGGAWWIALLVALPFIGRTPFAAGGRPLVWWGLTFDAASFHAVLALVAAGWAVIGVWRLMGRALQMPQRPGFWVGFLIWLALFAAGFAEWGSGAWRVAVALSAAGSTAAYALLFLEPPTRQLAHRLLLRRWSALPLWAVSLALALAAGAIGSLLAPAEAAPRGLPALVGGGLPLAAALLAVRDLALACAVHWGLRSRRAESATLLLWALLNLVLPWLLHAAGARALATWLQPLAGLDATSGGGLAIGIALLQAAVALGIALLCWSRERPAH